MRRQEFACRFLQEFQGPGLAVSLQIGIGEHGSLANEDDRVPEHTRSLTSKCTPSGLFH